MSRSLDDLHKEFRPMVDAWLADMRAVDLDSLITCTLRSGVEQDALWEQGRSLPGKIVTYKKAGQSAHQYGCAVDFVMLIPGGKLDWSGDSELWNRAINLANARGMQSLRPMESAHLQLPNWQSLISSSISQP